MDKRYVTDKIFVPPKDTENNQQNNEVLIVEYKYLLVETMQLIYPKFSLDWRCEYIGKDAQEMVNNILVILNELHLANIDIDPYRRKDGLEAGYLSLCHYWKILGQIRRAYWEARANGYKEGERQGKAAGTTKAVIEHVSNSAQIEMISKKTYKKENFIKAPQNWEGLPVVEGPSCYFVLDVESIGLHGEGFAVGFTVVMADGKELEEGLLSCSIHEASTRDSSAYGLVSEPVGGDGNSSWVFGGDMTPGMKNLKWVCDNVPVLPVTHPNPKGVRNAFWERWLYWRERGAVMVADCAWPVEARFLLACVDEHLPSREWQGPYPLHDLATLLLAQGHNPIGTFPRLPSELPAHNPLCDARQSARILLDLLKNRGLTLPNLK